MKKKLLLTCLMISLLVIVFAVSAFAEEIIVSKTESEEYGTVIQLSADPGLDNAKNYVSTLNKINNGSTDLESLCILTDGTYYYVFPSSYIVDEREDGRFDIIATALAEAMASSGETPAYWAGTSGWTGAGGSSCFWAAISRSRDSSALPCCSAFSASFLALSAFFSR